MAALSIVIADLDGDAARAVDSVREAAASDGIEVELIVVGHGREPSAGGDRSLRVLPLGLPYARNRGLALASSANVAFLRGDLVAGGSWPREALRGLEGAEAVAGPVGRAAGLLPDLHGRLALSPLLHAGAANAAFACAPLLSAGGFAHEPARSGEAEAFFRLARAGRTTSWRRHLAAAGPARRRARAATPEQLLAGLPAELAAVLAAAPTALARSHPAKTHVLYSSGPDRILHLHANPSARLERAVAEREEIRRRAQVGGIPKLEAVARAPDSLWLLEERLPGSTPEVSAADEWFDRAADWAVGMAGPPGRRLGDVPSWQEHRAAVLGFAPPETLRRVERALAAVSELRAVHMHGDLQPRNLVEHRGAFGAVDWEGAWLEGVPGLDLVFLALYANLDPPAAGVLERLGRGEDVPGRPLLSRLSRLGVDAAVLPELVVALLAVWALSEHRRLTRLGSPPRQPVFAPLLRRVSAGT